MKLYRLSQTIIIELILFYIHCLFYILYEIINSKYKHFSRTGSFSRTCQFLKMLLLHREHGGPGTGTGVLWSNITSVQVGTGVLRSNITLVQVGTGTGALRSRYWYWSAPVQHHFGPGRYWYWSTPVQVLVLGHSGPTSLRSRYWYWSCLLYTSPSPRDS